LLLALGAYVARFHAADIPLGPSLALTFPVSHRLTGGLMLIASLILTLRAYRRSGWSESEASREALSPKVVV